MCGTGLIGTPEWVERVAKEDQPDDGQVVTACHHLRGDAPPHRLPTDNQPWRDTCHPAPCVVDHRAEARFKTIHRIRSAAALFHVEEVEGHDVETSTCEATREVCYERVSLRSARTVGQYSRCFEG